MAKQAKGFGYHDATEAPTEAVSTFTLDLVGLEAHISGDSLVLRIATKPVPMDSLSDVAAEVGAEDPDGLAARLARVIQTTVASEMLAKRLTNRG